MIPRLLLVLAVLTPLTCGCAVVAVADAAVSVVSTTVSAGASVVGATADVAAAGIGAATGTSKDTLTGE